MTRDRLLFYCQHSLGLGHLVRSLRAGRGAGRALRRRAAQRRPVAGRDERAGRRRASSTCRRSATTRDGQLVSHDAGGPVEQACALRARAACWRRSTDARPAVRADRAVPVRPAEVRVRAACRCWTRRPRCGAAGRWSSAACATSSSAARRPASAHDDARPPGCQRLLRRRRSCTPTRRSPARGVVPAGDPAARAGPLHRLRRAAGARRRPAAGCRGWWSRPAAAWSASRCARPPWRRSRDPVRPDRAATTLVAGPFLPEPALGRLHAAGRRRPGAGGRAPGRRPGRRDRRARPCR